MFVSSFEPVKTLVPHILQRYVPSINYMICFIGITKLKQQKPKLKISPELSIPQGQILHSPLLLIVCRWEGPINTITSQPQYKHFDFSPSALG